MPETMNLRRLHEQGIARFGDFLDSLTGNAPLPYPSALLADPEATEEIQPAIEVEQRTFGSRYAAAEYLYNLFKNSGLTAIERGRLLFVWGPILASSSRLPELLLRLRSATVRPTVRARGARAFCRPVG